MKDNMSFSDDLEIKLGVSEDVAKGKRRVEESPLNKTLENLREDILKAQKALKDNDNSSPI